MGIINKPALFPPLFYHCLNTLDLQMKIMKIQCVYGVRHTDVLKLERLAAWIYTMACVLLPECVEARFIPKCLGMWDKVSCYCRKFFQLIFSIIPKSLHLTWVFMVLPYYVWLKLVTTQWDQHHALLFHMIILITTPSDHTATPLYQTQHCSLPQGQILLINIRWLST